MTTHQIKDYSLKFVSFRDIALWDVKRYVSEHIKSKYPVVKLGLLINEENHKVNLYDYPTEEFGILGVNNKIGIFDAYKEKGSNINQAYKKMEEGWLAYNPYRVNVGSIGLKREINRYEYISPAYVVFSCKEPLIPDFLFKLFKTPKFNKIINKSTTGSVRQNLTIDILKSLDIPVPDISSQTELLNKYNEKHYLAEWQRLRISILKGELEEYFINELGIKRTEPDKVTKGLKLIRFKHLSRWAVSYITNVKSYAFENIKYEIVPLRAVIRSFEGGKTPSTSNKHYWNGNICWTSPKDFSSNEILDTEDKITKEALKTGLKVYPKGVILGVFRSGILRHSFPVAITRVETAINQDVKAMEVNPELVDRDFFLFYLDCFQKLILESSSKVGVTVESINSDEFLEVPIVLPPLNEQIKIVKELMARREEINLLERQNEENLKTAMEEFENAIFMD